MGASQSSMLAAPPKKPALDEDGFPIEDWQTEYEQLSEVWSDGLQ